VTALTFAVTEARPQKYDAVPSLHFRLRISEAAGAPIHAILLRCQVQIEPRRRGHAPAEQERMTDLFGEPARWNETLRPLLWAQTSIAVPAFAGSTEVDLPLPCTYDFEVVWAKYLQALDSGEAPLLFLFSGTVFAKSENGYRVEQVPWNKEASFRMPVALWRDLMDAYFPGCGWIRLERESLDALQRFRARHSLASWEQTMAALLAAAEAPVS